MKISYLITVKYGHVMLLLNSNVFSGLKSVFWKLGTRSGMSNIGTGALPVVKEQNNVSCMKRFISACKWLYGEFVHKNTGGESGLKKFMICDIYTLKVTLC